PDHADDDPRGRRRLAAVDVRAVRGASRGVRAPEGAGLEDPAHGDLRAADDGHGRGLRGDGPAHRARVPARGSRGARVGLAALRRYRGPRRRLPPRERRARRCGRADDRDRHARAVVPAPLSPGRRAALCVLALAVAGCSRRRGVSLDEFGRKLEELCDRLLYDYPGVHVVLETNAYIDPVRNASDQLNEEYDRAYDVVRRVARTRHYPLVDLFARFEREVRA